MPFFSGPAELKSFLTVVKVLSCFVGYREVVGLNFNRGIGSSVFQNYTTSFKGLVVENVFDINLAYRSIQ